KVRQLRALVESGEDPQGDKQQKKIADQPQFISDLVNLFRSEYLPRKKQSTQQDYISRIENVIIPKFGKYRVGELKPLEIRNVLSTIGKSQPVHANRVQSILSVIFEHAIS